jgi:SAM-dependent methyltransferase
MGSDPLFTKNVNRAVASEHYSYAAYADPAMAAGFEQARFGGPIGRLLLEDQERALATFLGDVTAKPILDVGTGTGRAAIALAKRGALVTGVDASREMLAVAKTRAAEERVAIDFLEGDAHSLRFPDRSFASVVCLRVLMHVPDWRRAIGELCRIANRQLILDFPAIASVAVIETVWRRVLAGLGRRVEAYRVFSLGEIERELGRHGFRVTAVHRQFVLPIALHKLVGSARLTRSVESALRSLGLLRMVGTPVTVSAERCAS